jgi:hypothetical protein
MSTPTPKRCAIYTRKSTEEGLEQDYNSLEAQRDAARAFIASQKQEGLTFIPTVPTVPDRSIQLRKNASQAARGHGFRKAAIHGLSQQFHPLAIPF